MPQAVHLPSNDTETRLSSTFYMLVKPSKACKTLLVRTQKRDDLWERYIVPILCAEIKEVMDFLDTFPAATGAQSGPIYVV